MINSLQQQSYWAISADLRAFCTELSTETVHKNGRFVQGMRYLSWLFFNQSFCRGDKSVYRVKNLSKFHP